MKATMILTALLVSNFAFATKPATKPAATPATPVVVEKVETVTTTTKKVEDVKATVNVKGKEAATATKDAVKAAEKAVKSN